MKGRVAVFIALVIAGVLLWYQSNRITEGAQANREFMALYGAARAARDRRLVYAPPAPRTVSVESETLEAEPNEPVALHAAEATQSTDSLVPGVSVAAQELAPPPSGPYPFRYPPYVAVMLMPLTFASGVEAAATAWYWTNVVLFIAAMLLSMYALSGRFDTSRSGLLLVPLVISIPLIIFYLPVQGIGVLTLALVLTGLCAFRRNLDVLAGLVSSLALYSPLGVLFAFYYLAKRAWTALLGVAIGAAVWLVLVPILYFGPAGALDLSDAYVSSVLAPMPAQATSQEYIDVADNQSVWAMVNRKSSGIAALADETAAFAEKYRVNIQTVRENSHLVAVILLGVILVLGTALGVLRKLHDRDLAIVGLEGALLVTAKLMLWPYSGPSSLVILIFPLLAVTYVITATDVRKIVHHVNYLGLIAAAVGFYAALNAKYLALGSAFAGVFVLWVAILAAINRFRPHIIRGQRVTMTPGALPTAVLDRPIELAKARGAEKKEKKAKAKRLGGILPMPSFIRRKTEPEDEPAEKKDDEPKPDEKGPIPVAPPEETKINGTIRLE